VPRDADHGVRQLVLVHGHTDARAKTPPERKALVDIAAGVLADETQAVGITYTGFCLTGLPHKRLPNDQAWEKTGHRVRLLVEPGRRKGGTGTATYIGVPYGARARMILLYLQTQAVRTNSREIELGRSLHDWLGRMGLSWGGETGKALRDQAARIAACSLKFYWKGEDASSWEAGRFVRSGLRFHDRPDDDQGMLWEDRVVLDEVFWDALRRHPVPLQEAALRALVSRSASLDLYIWLAYRLHTLNGPTPIPWPTLRTQFGTGYAAAGAFRRDFCKALAPAVAAYPGARVNVEDKGVVLHPSPPPVARRIVSGASVS
jgi:hypothetical protein